MHAWESTRKGRAGYWEMLYWAAALICQTAALAYGKYLLLVCAVQLCEGHSALLRLRALQFRATIHRAASDPSTAPEVALLSSGDQPVGVGALEQLRWSKLQPIVEGLQTFYARHHS